MINSKTAGGDSNAKLHMKRLTAVRHTRRRSLMNWLTLHTHLPHTCSRRSICCWGLGCEVYTRVVSGRNKNLQCNKHTLIAYADMEIIYMTLREDTTATISTCVWSRKTCVTRTHLRGSRGGGHTARWHQRLQSHFHCWGFYSAACLRREESTTWR